MHYRLQWKVVKTNVKVDHKYHSGTSEIFYPSSPVKCTGRELIPDIAEVSKKNLRLDNTVSVGPIISLILSISV